MPTEDVNGCVKHAENRFDVYVRKHVRSAAQLMIPGNYLMEQFSEKNLSAILFPILNEDLSLSEKWLEYRNGSSRCQRMCKTC